MTLQEVSYVRKGLRRRTPISRVRPKKASRTRVKTEKVSTIKKRLESQQKAIVIKKYGNDCYTCPQKNLEGTNCQLGHVPWPRSILGPKVKFDYRFTRIQCFRCNINCGGNGAVAYKRMQEEGIDLDAMWKESETEKGKVVPRQWYLDKTAEYKAILEA